MQTEESYERIAPFLFEQFATHIGLGRRTTADS